MVDLGGRVVVADELLIPAHDGNVWFVGCCCWGSYSLLMQGEGGGSSSWD
jgi:hypothetical protein